MGKAEKINSLDLFEKIKRVNIAYEIQEYIFEVNSEVDEYQIERVLEND
jgi:hypothetical protein